MSVLEPPPGVVVMTVGDARREFPGREIGPALPPWGDSPAVPREADDRWCWVLDGGVEIRERFMTREQAVRDAWRILWWVHQRHRFTAREDKRKMSEAQIAFLAEQGWGFPEGYKEARRRSNEIRRRQGELIRQEREKLEKATS